MSPAQVQSPPPGKCPLCGRAVPIGNPCAYFVCQGYQKTGIPEADADAALKLKADRSSRGEYTLSHVGRWFGEWLILSAVSGDRNGPIFKASRRVHPRRLEVRPEPSTLRIFTTETWHEVKHLAEEQLQWRFPGVVTWEAIGDVGGQGWASHRWLGHYSLLSERLLPGRPLVDVEPVLASAAVTTLMDGLMALHGAGIAHGAIRPDQIAFLERGTQVDALLLGPSDLPFYVPTQQAPGGADAGLAWAAPERFDETTGSDDADVDESEPLSGDVYSAALLISELIAGRRPFALPTLHVRRQKRDPKADPLATARALLPPAVLDVLDAATRFEPATRLPDAAALHGKLLPLLPKLMRVASPSVSLPPRVEAPEPPLVQVAVASAEPLRATSQVTSRAVAARAETARAETARAETARAETARAETARAETARAVAAEPAVAAAPRHDSAVATPDPRLEAALTRAASAEAATRAIREALATSEREWTERMAGVTTRLRDAEAALSARVEERRVAPAAPPEPEPVPTRNVARPSWLLALVALLMGALVGAMAASWLQPTPVPSAPPPLVVNSRLVHTGGKTAVRVLVPAPAGEGTLVGTLRLAGTSASRDVPVARAITSAERAEGVLLFDDTVPFMVDSVTVVSLRLE